LNNEIVLKTIEIIFKKETVILASIEFVLKCQSKKFMPYYSIELSIGKTIASKTSNFARAAFFLGFRLKNRIF
jgi:hypothetical protein